MSNSVKYYMDEGFHEKEREEELPENVVSMLDAFRLLSLEEKILAKRVINQEKLF